MLKERTVIDGTQRLQEKEDSKISLICLLWETGVGLHFLAIPPERIYKVTMARPYVTTEV